MSSGKKHKYIGVCLTKMHEHLQNSFIVSIINQAKKYDFKLLIFNSCTDLYTQDIYDLGEQQIFDKIPYDLLDGLIIMGETIKNEDILNRIVANARQRKIYTVCVDKHIEGCFNIIFNYRSAFEAIVEHVVTKHNCRTINLVAGFRNNAFSDERIDCCRRVLQRHGLELDENRILYGDFWADPTSRAFDEFMLSGLKMPDAFICCNDSMAMTICSKLKDIGMSIPDDVIVTGFDGIYEERYHIPRLSTAKQDLELAGVKAINAIARHNTDNNGELRTETCVIDHMPVWSQSCGCLPMDLRSEFSQIRPLLDMASANDDFDFHMYNFNTHASEANGLADLAEKVFYYNSWYGYYYFAICLDHEFMNISDKYDKFISGSSSDDDCSEEKNKLILCENDNDHRYEYQYAEYPQHLSAAIDKFNVFIFLSVHFQDQGMGYAISALDPELLGPYTGDYYRYMPKYTRNLNQVLEMANSQSVLKKVIAKLQDLYVRDHTGLYNRQGFYSEISRYISEVKSTPEKPASLIIISIDMDGLKFINDTYGHSEGDIAIKAIASALISVWGVNEICSRFGGDEFILASISDEPEAKVSELTKKIQLYLDNFNISSGKPYTISASLGTYYEKISPELIVDSLIKAADDSMYKEKSTHKNSRENKYRSVPRK